MCRLKREIFFRRPICSINGKHKRKIKPKYKPRQHSPLLKVFSPYRLVFKAKAFLTDNKVLSASDTLSFLYFVSL